MNPETFIHSLRAQGRTFDYIKHALYVLARENEQLRDHYFNVMKEIMKIELDKAIDNFSL